MSSDQPAIVDRSRHDLAQRLGLSESEIALESVAATDFPDAALGAPIEDEMSAQVMTPGWRIRLLANGKSHEYRASAQQLRLFNFDGENYRL